MQTTTQTRKALQAARELVLIARNNGGSREALEGVWVYLRNELDAIEGGR